MSKINLLNTKQVAEIERITERRVRKKVKEGKYPHAQKCLCEHESWLIPEKDVKNQSRIKRIKNDE